MYQYSPAKMKSKRKAVIPVGNYTALVLSVTFDEDYVEDQMLVLSYELTDQNGVTYLFTERFENNLNNQRTKCFIDYLRANGVEDIMVDFVGSKENVVLKKCKSANGVTFINIVSRDFVR